MIETEKNIFKRRKEIPLKASPEDLKETAQKIEELKSHTEKAKNKYSELEDFKKLAVEVKKEKGEEYAFNNILIGKKRKENEKREIIFVFASFPQYVNVPEDILKHYRRIKEIVKKHREYINTAIKRGFVHEKEHTLEGPAQRSTEKGHKKMVEFKERTRKLEKELLGNLFKGKIEETKNDSEKIEFLKKEVESFINRFPADIEKQTELQSLLSDKEIGETAIFRSITHMLNVGIDVFIRDMKAKSEPERFVRQFLMYFENYPSLKTKTIKGLAEKHIQVENKIKEEYEEWKKQKEKSLGYFKKVLLPNR